mgnify:CR=1 FL=1
MKRKIISAVCLIFSTLLSFSQISDTTSEWRNDFRSKVFTGGNLGLQFGNYTFIDVSPLIGYRFTKKIHSGIGVTYRYFSDNLNKFSTSIYGGSIFSRYYILDNLFAHGEYEVLNGEWLYGKRFNVTSIFAGAGYSQNLGGKIVANVLILWNINESVYSPYRNPIFRAGIGIGL